MSIFINILTLQQEKNELENTRRRFSSFEIVFS